eukprot:UN04798
MKRIFRLHFKIIILSMIFKIYIKINPLPVLSVFSFINVSRHISTFTCE